MFTDTSIIFMANKEWEKKTIDHIEIMIIIILIAGASLGVKN